MKGKRTVFLLVLLLLIQSLALAAGGGPKLRVGLAVDQFAAQVSSAGKIKVVDSRGKTTVLNPGSHFISVKNGSLYADQKKLEGSQVSLVAADARNPVLVHQKKYRGALTVLLNSGKKNLNVVNTLPLEQYLYGVVAKEVLPLWPDEAIKAQAVAARSFALYSLEHGKYPNFDIRSNELGQVYGGLSAEHANTSRLVDATSGKYEIGQLFAGYFHTELVKPVHLEPDAFSLLGDVTAAEAAFHSYTSAVDALYGVLAPKLKELDLWDLYATAELPLCRVLAEMELAGCRVDKGALVSFGEMLSEKAGALEQDIYNMAGEEFNINSPKQLGEILFGKLGLPHGKKTKTGWSTNADVLEKLRYEAPIVGAVLEYRQYAKLKSTYAEGLLKAMDPDGRIRTRFQMTVTATGRLSSTEPNLQNIPTRTDLGSEIRRMFIPAEGCVLVDADYSQIELRLLAHISGDEAMRAAFTTGADIHTATAAQVFHVAPGDVTHEMRRRAKAVNFGIVYGISAFSLSQDIGVTVAEAKAYMEAYFATFPGVRKYMDDVVAQAKERGYVETLFHRRRDLPEIKSSNFNMRSFGERVALNMPIQGTAADIMKLAMVAVEKRLKKELPEAKLVLQVHDELIVECPEPQAEAAAKLLEEEMEQVAHLSVPLTAEAHWGRNWLEAKG